AAHHSCARRQTPTDCPQTFRSVCLLKPRDWSQTGDIAIPGSDAYADFRDQLLPWSVCEPAVADYCGQVGIPMIAPESVANLRTWLAQTAERVDAGPRRWPRRPISW